MVNIMLPNPKFMYIGFDLFDLIH